MPPAPPLTLITGLRSARVDQGVTNCPCCSALAAGDQLGLPSSGVLRAPRGRSDGRDVGSGPWGTDAGVSFFGVGPTSRNRHDGSLGLRAEGPVVATVMQSTLKDRVEAPDSGEG